MFEEERWGQFSRRNGHIYITIFYHFKCWKYCFQALMRVKIAEFSWGCAVSPIPPNYIWNKLHLFTYPLLCSDSSQYATIFSQSLISSGISPDILMHVLADCIIFLIRSAQLLFNFYLKQKQRFSQGRIEDLNATSVFCKCPILDVR